MSNYMKSYRLIGWIFNKPIIEEREVKMKKKSTSKKKTSKKAVRKTKKK